MNATQNLALYCASAVLEDFPVSDYIPPLPLTGERGANTETALTATVEPWRKLTYINMWPLDKFDEATQQAFANSMCIPTWDLRVSDFDTNTRSMITIAAGPQFTIPPNHLPLPEGVQGVREWVYHLPLRTAERVMKLINPNAETWSLDINQTSNQLSHLYTTCAWGPRRESPAATSSGFGRVVPNLLFVVQSPWTLSPADFRIFCERSMYRHYAKKNPKTGKIETTELDYVDKLWATIYDDCVRGNIHYFILTTYNEWSFGAFSRGWTTAWTTPPKPHNAGSAQVPGPTILQSVLFWMHSAQQFYFDSYRRRTSHQSFSEESGLHTPISPSLSLEDEDEDELDLASETDDNTLDRGWLNEMRTSVREIKDLKGARRPLAANGSWVIPEIWEDMEPPKPPPKRTRPLDPIEESQQSSEQYQDGWYDKRQRPTDDQHVTTRRARPALAPQRPRPRTQPRAGGEPDTIMRDISSTQANSSVSSAGTNSTHVLPGGFPSSRSASGVWSPWLSEDSPVKIFWSRTFMSVRTTLADAFRRLLRSREGEVSTPMFGPSPISPVPPPFSRQNERSPTAPPAQGLIESRRFTFNMSDSVPEVDENQSPPLASAPRLTVPLPQTTVALGGHTITLTPAPRPPLMSGIHLDQPKDQSWPPPRRPFMPLLVPTAESTSDATEIDPDAQRRPEFGFRDTTPNETYEM